MQVRVPGRRVPKLRLAPVRLAAIIAPERDGRAQRRVDDPRSLDVARRPRSVRARFSSLATAAAAAAGQDEPDGDQ